ncbi:hypothetical protein M8J77_010575 [Diaphorina citri]|nr:hypothetical protein M8J77_010575 [Diaphorina citri]
MFNPLRLSTNGPLPVFQSTGCGFESEPNDLVNHKPDDLDRELDQSHARRGNNNNKKKNNNNKIMKKEDGRGKDEEEKEED